MTLASESREDNLVEGLVITETGLPGVLFGQCSNEGFAMATVTTLTLESVYHRLHWKFAGTRRMKDKNKIFRETHKTLTNNKT